MAENMKDNKIGLGKIGEQVLYSLFHSIFDRDHYRIKSNDYKNYNNGIGHGTDFKIWLGSCLLFDIEVKNWKLFSKPYGHDIIESEIIQRFRTSTAKYRILVISFIGLLSKSGLNLLKRNNIHVFSLDTLLGHKIFKSRLLYEIQAQLKQFITQLRQPIFNQIRLIDYTSNTVNCNTSHAILQTTDTPTDSSMDRIREYKDDTRTTLV